MIRRKCGTLLSIYAILLVTFLEYGNCASRSVKDPAKFKKSLNSVTSGNYERTPENTPRLGVCERDFAGRDTKVIAETGGGLPLVEDATLPILKVEDHIWEGKSIQLTCNASYPVKFEYIGPGMPIVKTETYRKAPDFYDPKTYSYAVSVVFSHTTEQQSGNYTCRSIKEPALATYMYLFVPGSHVFIGDSVTPANETILVRAKDRDQWVTLPCATSLKDSQVQLFKILASGRLQEIPLSDSVAFDVASGFHLKWRGAGALNETWGNYLCRVSGERYEKIHLRLMPPERNDPLMKIRVTYPELRLRIVISVLKYNWKKLVETVRPIVRGDAEENSLTYERESVTGSSKLRITFDQENDMIECCATEPQLRPKMKITPCSSTNDCQMAKKYLEKSCDLLKNTNCDNFVDQISGGCVGYPLATGSVSEGGILQCMVDETESVFMQFSYGSGGLVSDFSTIPQTSRILNIAREDTRNKTVGRYYCDANQFFFSHGLKWAIKKRDGSIELLPEKKFPQRPIKEIDETQAVEVICYAPVWDSLTDWKSASMKTPKS
ncbi:Platelet-derived growth factor receptor alpha [Orchesella cincta]|uniref:Platelet-derived growth factor receptor alpha n=1 Tax=Orchesella cincta TaxID=48709 RepID=A0A1D2N724_ORCCI|nr:Platelet-derived growth factor receptor alpha [Orchesella cincta]